LPKVNPKRNRETPLFDLQNLTISVFKITPSVALTAKKSFCGSPKEEFSEYPSAPGVELHYSGMERTVYHRAGRLLSPLVGLLVNMPQFQNDKV